MRPTKPPVCHTSAMAQSSDSTDVVRPGSTAGSSTVTGSTTVPALLPHLWKTTLLSGVAAVILGVLVLAWPGTTILVAAIIFGVYLLVSGIAQVVFAFTLHVSAGGRVLLFISGAAALVLAVLCFRSLQESILLLAIWIGIGFIFRGVATAVSAISDPTLPGRGWEIFFGVVSLLAGVVMLATPFGSLGVLTLVVGVWLIVLGVFEVIAALGIRKAANAVSS
ncbi:membrane protein [Mycolicibacterium chitae]|uniref:Integral membrane protein n=1 Tax=Mycolicibacterium chitae TaxID=1792 RepID=A0A448I7E2_MYCCI|nr:membrane protein [Mycolicibacterium chitae]VEG48222.1 integral membrane protein [Mycolicibacterium chitae]